VFVVAFLLLFLVSRVLSRIAPPAPLIEPGTAGARP
jgi:hypothetical protein